MERVTHEDILKTLWILDSLVVDRPLLLVRQVHELDRHNSPTSHSSAGEDEDLVTTNALAILLIRQLLQPRLQQSCHIGLFLLLHLDIRTTISRIGTISGGFARQFGNFCDDEFLQKLFNVAFWLHPDEGEQ